MGTRIYPNTTDRAKLEQLAGVPAGTYDALDASQANEKQEIADLVQREALLFGATAHPADVQDIGYRYWKERNEGDIGELDAFLTWGYGKFRHVPSSFPEFWEEHEEYGKCITPCGSCQSQEANVALARAQGISMDHLELAGGLCWS